MNNYFEKGTPRQSLTARLPNKVADDLTIHKQSITQKTGLKISRNDLLTIGGILISELDFDEKSLESVNSLSELTALIKAKLTEKP
jgi:hypothetical protein